MGSHLEDGKEVFSTSRELGLEEDQPVALAQGDEVPQRRGGAEDGLEPVRLLGEGGGAQEELPEVGELLYGHCLVHVSCESVFTLTPHWSCCTGMCILRRYCRASDIIERTTK